MILIIDDKQESVQGVIDFLDEKKIEYEYQQDFDKGLELFKRESNLIDLLVLDLKKDPTEEYPGRTILKNLWETKFVPTAVFSVSPDELGISHNFIKTFNKTQEEEVIEWINDMLANYIDRINNVKIAINEIYRDGLRGLNLDYSDEENSLSVINYMAYVLEQKMHSEDRSNRIKAKVQYILLNQYKSLEATDIIQTIPNEGEVPEFYMIITASCDLANDKYKQVVCKKIEEIDNQTYLRNKKYINDGGYKGVIFLPENIYFKNHAVLCKYTHVIPDKAKISTNPTETDTAMYAYKKIISFASPYKERILSLIYNHDGRIGVPDLDENSWWIDEAQS